MQSKNNVNPTNNSDGLKPKHSIPIQQFLAPTHAMHSPSSRTNGRRIILNFRWSPRIFFDKIYDNSSSGGNRSDIEGDGGGSSPQTVVQSAADEDQEAARSTISFSHRSKSFCSNNSVAGSQATTSAQPPIKTLPDIR